MRVLYIDCGMGAAGDMLSAALSEIMPDGIDLVQEMNASGLDGVEVKKERSVKCGVTGTHFSVLIHGEEEEADPQDHDQDHHHHASMAEIREIVMNLNLPQKVRDDVMNVYERIASAESQVHGAPVSEIHFHEVGSKDAIADIAAVCLGMYHLQADKVIVSPIHVGSGKVRCAHGILPVPAPATALLLKNIPIYSTDVKGELCTPTGAALLGYFADSFEKMPVMRTQKIGYGMGKKDFEQANCVRMLLGDTEDAGDEILNLSCNLDDMTGEEIGFAMEQLFASGARDVFTTPIYMKKNRPGSMLTVICTPDKKEEILNTLFLHTTTLGVREERMQRYILKRNSETKDTPYGKVSLKTAEGYGARKEKIEFEDLARIAREEKLSLWQVREKLHQ